VPAPRAMLRVMTNTTELEALIARLVTIDYSQGSEQATREMAVNPVIGALGWDTFDPNEVAREYSVRGGRVDYCLRGQGSNLVLVEVKKAGTDLTEHQEQLLRYAFAESVPMAALTDGLAWWLYLPKAGGSWEQRRFFRVSFLEHTAAHAASALNRFLEREASISGAALDEAQREFESQERDRQVRAALQDAWLDELRDPGSLLHDLLAERVRNHTGLDPDSGTIAEFLGGIAGGASAEHAVLRVDAEPTRGGAPPQPTPMGPTREEPKSFKGRRPVAFRLDGTRREIRSWRELLTELCERLAKGAEAEFVESVTRPEGPSYFRSSAPDSPYWVPIANTGLYIYVNITGTTAADRARRIVATVRGSAEGFEIETQLRSSEPEPPREEPGPASFMGRQPTAFWLDDARHEVTRWRALLQEVCGLMAAASGSSFGDRVSRIRGTTRPYFSRDPEILSSAVSIKNSDLFVEGNFSADACVRLARSVLVAVRGNDDGFSIELAE